jgi:hypothetical protein
MLACFESSIDFWIHTDTQILILHDLLVPLGYLGIHPLLEDRADHRVDDIC